MKVTIEQIKKFYEITEQLSFTGMEISEINKIINARDAIRSHYNAYKAFNEDLQKAHKPKEEDWNFLVEVEKNGLKNASPEDLKRHNEIAKPYVTAINDALNPKLAEEVDIEIEKISKDSVAALLANQRFNILMLNEYLSFIMP